MHVEKLHIGVMTQVVRNLCEEWQFKQRSAFIHQTQQCSQPKPFQCCISVPTFLWKIAYLGFFYLPLHFWHIILKHPAYTFSKQFQKFNGLLYIVISLTGSKINISSFKRLLQTFCALVSPRKDWIKVSHAKTLSRECWTLYVPNNEFMKISFSKAFFINFWNSFRIFTQSFNKY